MNPYIFQLGKFGIRWYSVLIIVGVLINLIIVNKSLKKYGADSDFITNLVFWTIIFGVIGARLYYVAFNFSYYQEHILEIFQVWKGGLAIHGALIGGILTIICFCAKRKSKILLTLDILAPTVLLAQAIGRWGNFFNSEAYGSATTLEALQNMKIIPEFVINGMNINGTYYLPMFYFESLFCLLGVIIILIMRRYRYLKNGQQFGFYLMWYSLGRFFIEKYRMDSLFAGELKIAQIMSVALFIIGFVVIIYQSNKPKLEELYNSKQKIQKELIIPKEETKNNV